MSAIGSISKLNVIAQTTNYQWKVYICVNEVGWHCTYDRWDTGYGSDKGSSVLIDLSNMNIPAGYDFFVYIDVIGGCDVIGMQRFTYDPSGTAAEYYLSGQSMTPHLTGNYYGTPLTGSY